MGTAAPSNPDLEIAAMAELARTLSPLSPEAKARVLAWACSHFEVTVSPIRDERMRPTRQPAGAPNDFDDAAALFAAANPTTNGDKALVIGYWFQQIEGNKDLDAQQVNTQLKQLGHGIANITGAFNDLMGTMPKLAIQVRKGGATRQARKRYRITTEGLKRVADLLAGGAQ
jgi:hypothetical protein